MTDRIERTRHADGVVELHLSRADKMNALDPAMFDALIEAGEALREDKAVRAVVISGRGKAFCAGLDMASFERMQQQDAGAACWARAPPAPTWWCARMASRMPRSRSRWSGARCRCQ